MTRFHYEIWPAKGDGPICVFDTEADARDFRDRRCQAVPGLRIFCVTVTTNRRDVDAMPQPQRLRKVA